MLVAFVSYMQIRQRARDLSASAHFLLDDDNLVIVFASSEILNGNRTNSYDIE